MNHRRPRRHRDKKKTTHSRKRYQLRHAAGPGPAADMLPGVAATMRPAGASDGPARGRATIVTGGEPDASDARTSMVTSEAPRAIAG